MGKYWKMLDYELRKYPGHQYVGTLALKWKRKDEWNLVLYRKGGRQEYITYFKGKPEEQEVLRKTAKKIKQKYPKCSIWRTYRPKLPEKGFKVFETYYGEIWMRRSKKGYYSLCLCKNYKILKSKPLRKEDACKLWELNKYNEQNIEAKKKTFEIVKKYGILRETSERSKMSVEDWGYGTIAQEYAENGTLQQRLQDAIEDGDTELARWLLNSPEDARAMHIDEKIIKWAFGSEEEEDDY